MKRLSCGLVRRVRITYAPTNDPAAARTAMTTRNVPSRLPSAAWPRNPDSDEKTTASAVGPGRHLRVEPAPGQARQDDVPAADPEQAAEKPGDPANPRPDARLGRGASGGPGRGRPVEEHHRPGEDEEGHEQPEQDLPVDADGERGPDGGEDHRRDEHRDTGPPVDEPRTCVADRRHRQAHRVEEQRRRGRLGEGHAEVVEQRHEQERGAQARHRHDAREDEDRRPADD